MVNTIANVSTILNNNDMLSSDFGKFSKIYLMTTENIKDFLDQYSLQDKSILTVAGSGDQMLNAYLMGAKNVTCFDINPLAFYQVKLKKAAVCALDYDEYLKFFFQEFNALLNKNTFDKIIDYLDEDTMNFFNYLYSKYNCKQIFDKIYYRFQPDLEQIKRMNAYLEKDNYEFLSYILKEKKINFIESDVTCLSEKLDNNFYDMILLSNISDNIENIWINDSLNNFKTTIYSLNKNLSLYGTIQVGYIYDYHAIKKDELFRRKKERQAVFTSDEFHTTFIGSYEDYNKKDGIVTFQKIKD